MGVLDQAAPAAAPNSLFNDSKFIGEADASNQLTQQEYSQTRNLLLDSKLEKAITPPLYMSLSTAESFLPTPPDATGGDGGLLNMEQWSPPPTSVMPPPPLSSGPHPASTEDAMAAEDGSPLPLCAGCRLRITDEFFLTSTERKWHSRCLKCVECGVELDGQLSCYEWKGQIFCKEDYHRLYALSGKRCGRCQLEINHQTELVIQTRHSSIFHPDCFRCGACDVLLKKGDFYAHVAGDDRVYCQQHCEFAAAPPPPPPLHPGLHPPPPHHPHHMPPHAHMHPAAPHVYPGQIPPPHMMSPAGEFGPYPPPGPGGYPPPHHFDPTWFPPGTTAPPMGSGDFPYDNNNDLVTPKKRRGRKKRKVSESIAAMNGFMDGAAAFAGGPPPGLDGQNKAKRARTSFKHGQLRIMKAHFQMNQNPDSRELKMLSQKTGLDKKVLQVWFQNARAKWRRLNAKGEGGGGNTVPQGPHSAGSSDQDAGGGAPPPPHMGSSPSSSSDCSAVASSAAAAAMITCC